MIILWYENYYILFLVDWSSFMWWCLRQSLVCCHRGLGSIPGQSVCIVWWTRWY